LSIFLFFVFDFLALPPPLSFRNLGYVTDYVRRGHFAKIFVDVLENDIPTDACW